MTRILAVRLKEKWFAWKRVAFASVRKIVGTGENPRLPAQPVKNTQIFLV